MVGEDAHHFEVLMEDYESLCNVRSRVHLRSIDKTTERKRTCTANCSEMCKVVVMVIARC